MPKKVCLQPCLGITSRASTIGRQACYAAYQGLGSDRADLGCAPALYAEVEEDVEFIRNDLVIAVNSCDACCANHLVAEKGGCAHAGVRVDEILEAAGMLTDDLPLEHAPLDHPAVALVAAEIRRVADELSAEEPE